MMVLFAGGSDNDADDADNDDKNIMMKRLADLKGWAGRDDGVVCGWK